MQESPDANTTLRRSIELAGGAMSFIEWPGRQEPTLLFAHANGFNAETYRTVLEPLGGFLHILACDLRGHGRSTLPTADVSANSWTVFRDDLIGAIEKTAIEPVILTGHSLGAVASLMAAAQLGTRVRALLVDLGRDELLASLDDEDARFLAGHQTGVDGIDDAVIDELLQDVWGVRGHRTMLDDATRPVEGASHGRQPRSDGGSHPAGADHLDSVEHV